MQALTATTIATSFIERAQNTSFDAVTDTMPQNAILINANLLTLPSRLGVETGEYADIDSLDDFDDFNNLTINYTPGWMNEVYKVNFKVYYVDTANINTIVTANPTFLKRMDIKVWRSFPSDSSQPSSFDTAKMSTIYGYYKFNPI